MTTRQPVPREKLYAAPCHSSQERNEIREIPVDHQNTAAVATDAISHNNLHYPPDNNQHIIYRAPAADSVGNSQNPPAKQNYYHEARRGTVEPAQYQYYRDPGM